MVILALNKYRVILFYLRPPYGIQVYKRKAEDDPKEGKQQCWGGVLMLMLMPSQEIAKRWFSYLSSVVGKVVVWASQGS